MSRFNDHLSNFMNTDGHLRSALSDFDLNSIYLRRNYLHKRAYEWVYNDEYRSKAAVVYNNKSN